MLTMCAEEHVPIIYETKFAPKNKFGDGICPLCFYLEMISNYQEQERELVQKNSKLQQKIKEIELQIIKKTHSENFKRHNDVKLNLE